jgi:hypothetical protein
MPPEVLAAIFIRARAIANEMQAPARVQQLLTH